MSDLLALSFDSVTAPAISLKEALVHQDSTGDFGAPRGWGFGWYPGVEMAGQILKDPATGAEDPAVGVLRDWNRFGSTTFICHFRGPAHHRTQSDAQPFLRNFSGRAWIIAHSGTLEGDWRHKLPLGEKPVFEPVGRTDTEHLFCWILNRMQAEGSRSMAEHGLDRLAADLKEINQLGQLNLLLTDGQSLAVYHDAEARQPIFWSRRAPPHVQMPMENNVLALELEPHQAHHTFIAFATEQLSEDAWVRMSPGQLLVSRRGQIIWDNLGVWDHPDIPRLQSAQPAATGDNPSLELFPPLAPAYAPLNQEAGGDVGPEPESSTESGPWRLHWHTRNTPGVHDSAQRTLHVLHETRYRYERPVQASHHVLRLQPVQDIHQTVEEFDLRLSVDGQVHRFEDVFGNQNLELNVTQPFTEFSVRAESRIRVSYVPALDARTPHRREQIPLVWMPWQRQMMQAYLLPPELPESHLTEISDFALSFADRNDYNLRDTLIDMNRTIYRDFEYLPGVTDLETTPYEILTRRKGVCQDFANLLICMARLMNIPARYRVGYIDTLATPENPVQSEASHAWTELYLPGAGWVGFDPTNGKLVGQEHVRIACGRNYRDATPTMGTLYKGGGGETLEVAVKVEHWEESD